MTPPVQPIRPPSLEETLAQQANAAMKAGADPGEATALLHQMIQHVRAHPDLAQQGSLALAHGADPSEVSSEVYRQMSGGNAIQESRGFPEAAGRAVLNSIKAPAESFGDLIAPTMEGAAEMNQPNSQYRENMRARFGTELPPVTGVTGKQRLIGGIQTAANVIAPELARIPYGGIPLAGAAVGAAYDPEHPVKGAMIGATTGLATRALGAAASGAGKFALDKMNLRPEEPITVGGVRLPVRTVDEEAARKVANAFAQSGRPIPSALTKFADKPQTLMELGGQPVARLARTARAASPKAGAQIDETLESRTAGAPDRAIADALETSGLQQRSSGFQTAQDLIAQRSADADKAYGAAFRDAKPVTDPRIQQVLNTDVGKKAWGRAQRTMSNLGMETPTAQVPTEINIPGAKGLPGFKATVPTEQPAPTLQQLHYLKLAMDDLMEPGLNRGAGEGGIGRTEGRSILGVQKKLISAMDDASPAYKSARKQFADQSALVKANDAGQQLFKMKPEEAAATYNQLGSDGEKEVFRRAGMDALADRLENGPADVEKGVSKPRDQRRIRLLFPDDQTFNQFKDRIAQEAQMVSTHRYVSGGSQTADKLADLSDMLNVGTLTKAVSGNVAGVAGDVAKAAMKLRGKAYGSRLGESLADLTTAGGNGGNELERALEQIRSAAAGAKPRGSKTALTLARAAGIYSGDQP